MASKVDVSEWDAALGNLQGPLRTSLARSMAVAGGKVLRDEAKLLAPVEEGVLRDAIYLAFKDDLSKGDRVVYSVTWNHRKAPHGHLIEFGHWQPYVVVKLSTGGYLTTRQLRASPKWIPAHPFLRPAFDGSGKRAVSAMIDRGRVRLPQLLAGATDEP